MAECSLLSLCSILFLAAVSDCRSRTIPNRLFAAGMIPAAVCRIVEPAALSGFDLAAGAVILCALLFIRSRHLMGGGDVKMILFMQLLYPGSKGLWILWFGLLFSGLAGIIGYIRFGKRAVRLGPGMFLGALTAAVGGYL